jgi:signal transduction histidine kinase
MSEVRTSRWPWAWWALLLCMLAGAIALSFENDTFDGFVLIAIPMMLGYGTIGAFVASRVPSNLLGWLMLTIGVSFGVTGLSSEYVVWAAAHDGPWLEVAAWFSNWTYLAVFTPLILIVLLFPTGRVPSPRWRFALYVIVGSGVALAVGTWIKPGNVDSDVVVENPTGVDALEPASAVLLTVGSIGLLVSVFAAVTALIVRYRTADPTQRRQIRALASLAGLALLLIIGAFTSVALTGATPDEDPLLVTEILFYALFFCVGVLFPAAIGYAILRQRLFDIDLVVKKTVTYSLIAIALTGLYLVILTFATLGVVSRQLVGLVLLAVTLRPIARAARAIADRVVYGRRATPYEVMSEFSARMAETYSTDDVLPRMASVLQGATGASDAQVWLRVGRELRPAASSPAGVARRGPILVTDDALPEMPGDLASEVRHQGELLGALAVTMPANDPIGPIRERLMSDLASQAGPVLRNVRLIEELRASRQRLVAAQDEERRRLERNIHDGAQQQLVALGVKLRLADTLVDHDAAKAHEMLGQLQTETQGAIDDLRDLARGIYPPLLADQGLTAALKAQSRKSSVEVAVDADGVSRYAQEIEAAVYFSCLEALQNVAKYAGADRASISLVQHDGSLDFTIADDGRGFDVDTVERGTGLQGIADRLDAIGGSVRVESKPGTGTNVYGTVPIDRPV